MSGNRLPYEARITVEADPVKVGDIVMIETPSMASDGTEYSTWAVATVTKVTEGGKALRIKRLGHKRGEPLVKGPTYHLTTKDVVDAAAIKAGAQPLIYSKAEAMDWLRRYATVDDVKQTQADVLADRFSELYNRFDRGGA